METITRSEVEEQLSHCESSACERDNQGQLVFYSGIFQWLDGSFHDVCDPSYESVNE